MSSSTTKTTSKRNAKLHDRLRDAKTLKTSGRDHLPLPTGPLKKIGCRDFMVGYSRKGGVLVRLFYPAKDDPNKPQNALLWPNWLPHENYRLGYTDVTGIRSKWLRRMVLRLNSNRHFFIPAIPNVKPMSSNQKYPVIVFSHGLGACRTTYSTMCIELASHGFVVAAVEHRDNTACLSYFARRARYSFRDSNPNFFPDQVDADGVMDEKAELVPPTQGVDEVDASDEVDFGDEIDDPNYIPPKALSALTNIAHLEMAWIRFRYVPVHKHSPQIYNFRNKQIHHRVRECSRALDLLEALNAGYELDNLIDPAFNKSEFENMLDMDRAIIMGHSMGGATALMTAAAEIRFKVVVALDAWTYPIKDESLELIPQPVLTINTETMAADPPNIRKLAEVMTLIEGDDPDRRQSWTINGSKHFQQCDLPFIMSWFTLLVSGMSMGRTGTSTFDVHDLSMALSLQFIRKFLDMESNPVMAEYLEAKKKKLRPTFKKSDLQAASQTDV